MSLDKIGIFQKDIYEILKSDNILNKELKSIYLNIKKDASLPYVLINLLKLRDLSIEGKHSYEIEFEILLFTKDKNQEKILKTANHILDLLAINNLSSDLYNTAGLKFINAEWSRGNDPNLTKISLIYKGLINGK